MHSVIDFTGLNDLIRDVLDRAAGSIVGMVNKRAFYSSFNDLKKQGKPRVAMTMLNMCEQCAEYVKRHLEDDGYQVIGFSATGVPDMAMEELIEKEGSFCELTWPPVRWQRSWRYQAAGRTAWSGGQSRYPKLLRPPGQPDDSSQKQIQTGCSAPQEI